MHAAAGVGRSTRTRLPGCAHGRYPGLAAAGRPAATIVLSETELQRHVGAIEGVGYTIVEDAIDADLIAALAGDLLRIEHTLDVQPAGNAFEGAHTVRIYNLLAHSPVYAKIPTHDHVLPIVELVLDRGCLISSLSSISIDPGENAQPIHADDQLLPLPKPHPALVCNTMWALTDFTDENGATRIIPGSHTRDHSPEYGSEYASIPAEMRRGSVLIWHGSLWHGGGANRTRERRVGIAMNYCAGFIRQQENQQLGLSVDTVRSFSPRLLELLGYGIYRGLIGHIDKRSPAEVVLNRRLDSPIVWDEPGTARKQRG